MYLREVQGVHQDVWDPTQDELCSLPTLKQEGRRHSEEHEVDQDVTEAVQPDRFR